MQRKLNRNEIPSNITVAPERNPGKNEEYRTMDEATTDTETVPCTWTQMEQAATMKRRFVSTEDKPVQKVDYVSYHRSKKCRKGSISRKGRREIIDGREEDNRTRYFDLAVRDTIPSPSGLESADDEDDSYCEYSYHMLGSFDESIQDETETMIVLPKSAESLFPQAKVQAQAPGSVVNHRFAISEVDQMGHLDQRSWPDVPVRTHNFHAHPSVTQDDPMTEVAETMSKSSLVPTLRKKQTFANVLWHVIGAVVVMLSVLSFGKFLDLPHFFSAIPIIDKFWDVGTVGPDTVYVPGAGFSAFWFTLGRLQSIEDPASKDYYCFSAGCLSVVAMLSGRSMEDVLGLALDAQTRWKKGDLSRFDVVGDFVDGLLPSESKRNETLVFDGALVSGESKNGAEPLVDTTTLLSKLHVVTTAKTPTGLKHVIRNPTNTEELREMLVQTTWIPFATGGWFWTRDSQSGDRHLDGAFSVLSHPKCSHHLGLPLMLDLFINSLNINLSIEKVEQYWKAGLAHGL